MKKSNPFFYCLGQGIKSFTRNKGYTIASIVTVAACIFLVGIFLSVVFNMNHVISEAEQSVCITVFFDEDLTEEQIVEIGKTFREWPEVINTSYTSADQAWENFKQDYFRDNPDLADGFEGANPLTHSASYEIYLENIEQQDEIVDRLEATDGVRKVNRSEVTANALSDIGRVVGIVSIVLIIILLAVSIFLIMNTIVMGINMRKEEIQIMKYVGATDFFVKSPFIFEGIIIGLIGAIIPLIIIYLVYNSAIIYVMTQLQTLSSMFTFLTVWDIFKVVAPVALVIGAGIGIVGSSIATGKHIKV